MSALPKRWLREPLLHFLFIGVLLFAGTGCCIPSSPERPRSIASS